MTHRRAWLAAISLSLVVLMAVAAVWLRRTAGEPSPAVVVAAAGPPVFVGNASCSGCHQAAADAWSGSHHARAMQHAEPGAVLGDFSDAKLAVEGGDVLFTRRDGRFLVHTDGPDGEPAFFEIRYVIGFEPLQQYLVALPDGRLQALPYAWDARPVADGGQRWYSLYPGERIAAGDPLHWTGPYQNWNWMCADCHTTNLDRNYDAATDRFDTTWSEFNVGCEACHGPGSGHVAWAAHGDPGDARRGLVQSLDARRDGTWHTDQSTGLPARSAPLADRNELVACAQCHARRAPLAGGMDHDGRLLQTHDIALLGDGLYFHDGQQREEVYEVGSFMQSRMHGAGVTCSDCHEPHSGELRAPGDAVCGQCHAPSRFAQPGHTLHAAGTPGSACVDCHMPARDYMGIDARRDHSLRVPQPLLAAEVGAPDACTGCHADRDAAWADAVLRDAHGPDRSRTASAARAFHAVAGGDPAAGAALVAVASDGALPPITRATALAQIRAYLGPGNVAVAQAGLADADPMVRAAAVEAMQAAPASVRRQALLPLAGDDSRVVRIKVAEALADLDASSLAATERLALESAFAEYERSRRANADRAEARVELASFLALRGRTAQAEQELHAAIRLQPRFLPAHLSLADLLATLGRDAEVGAALDAADAQLPGEPALAHARGLLRVREGRLDLALPLLRAAVAGAPGQPRYAFVLAVALHDAGHPDQAIATLEAALRQHPGDPQLRATLDAYRQGAPR